MQMLRVLIVILAVQAMVLTQTGTASVEGVVVNAQTEAPLARALLELRAVDAGPARVYSQMTMADGRFTFRDVTPGRYQLTAMRQGFVRGDYGVRGPGASGIAVTLNAGQRLTAVRLPMLPTGTIAGKVTNQFGEGIGNVHVRALRYSYLDGRRTLVNVKSVFTNDLGEYRLGWLPPGRYHVSAQHPDGAPNELNAPEITNSATTWANTAVTNAGGLNGGSFDFRESADPAVRSRIGLADGEDYLPVYYPGTVDFRGAALIDVRAGAEIPGMDVMVSPVRTGIISGTLTVSAPTASTSIPIQVFRNPSYDLQSVVVRADARAGTFMVTGLAPGSYILAASAPSGSDRLAGHTLVEVSEGGVSGAQLMLEAGVRVPVRVSLDPSAPRINLRTLRVSLRSEPLIPGLADTPAVVPREDGSLELSAVLPGDYIVSVAPLMNLARATVPASMPTVPGPQAASPAIAVVGGRVVTADSALPAGGAAYVKSIRMGDQDLLNEPLRVDGRLFESPIEIVIAASGGEINGAVVDSRGRAMRATVVLVPDAGKRHRLDLYKTVVTDTAGRFRMSAVPPDDYVLLAWEDVETGAWLDTEFLTTVERQGTYVKIVEGGRVATQLTAIRQR
jgi:hypothetical protein